jgi:hypothetical protein
MSGIYVVLIVLVATAGINLFMKTKGYAIGSKAAVRCSKGHVFRTTWIEGGSLRSVRLGPLLRYQRCPGCRAFRLVRLLKESDLTDVERHALGEADG